ncbi:hypothetical protein SAICODRAFT_19147 [Saitoella complicata NRRL Y-17804]|uniref:uncharacterized protein n=1 Tax=Saitoella complicata (strain BCRC 22490 / CBS 7301 / JCM 7358 / NBRC 10748 / NRRL Y-17804) TaxID=698492 RepID=UPI00086718A3|nr:uncharacterized protein SAICODRAFT_19147 [Saitoella complicata NRRL Y-17804]ODQ53219.1 hypothetical protein SAICODRAFT_19147 [Saitoella complicata NRRL Y-17804]
MNRLADDVRGPERQASRPSPPPPSNTSNAGQRSGVIPSPARAPLPPSRNVDGAPTRLSSQVFRQAPPYNPGGPRDSPVGPPRGPRNPSFGSGPSPGPRGGFRGGAPYRGGFRQGPPPSFMNQRSSMSVASPATPSWSSPAGIRRQSTFGASHNGPADSPAVQGGEGEKVETWAPVVEESVRPVITRIGRVGYESIRPQLDEEVVRLRREYEELDRKDLEKQKRKRAAISDYNKAERDSTAIAYRVELAEQQLDGMLTGTILFD